MNRKITLLTAVAALFITTPSSIAQGIDSEKGNPVFEGWYADPEGIIYDNTYWIFPTWSDEYERQTFIDAFSSPDMVNWTRHHAVIDTADVKWATKCMWAPAVLRKDNLYYIFFGANDVHEGEIGGIGVGVSPRLMVHIMT